MLRRDQQLRKDIHQVKDAGLFALALWLAHALRAYVRVEGYDFEPFRQFLWLYLIIVPGAPLVLELQGFYKRPLLCPRRQTAWMLFKGCVIVTALVILVMFFFKILLARAVIISFGAISFWLIFLTEEIVQRGYKSRFGQLQLKKRVIIVGTSEDTRRLRAELSEKADDGFEVVGELDLNTSTIEELVVLLHQSSANGVILHAKHTFFGQIEKAIQACELEGVEAWLIAGFFQTQISRTTFHDFYGRPVLVFRSAPEASWQGLAKQLIDWIGAFILLVLCSPLLLVVSILVRRSSSGPALFRQQRAGLNGRPFSMLKFRSMVSDAEQRKAELAALNEMSGPVFKVTNDPRVTPIGRFLRKWSIDELPQLFNVLRGEMSLVGPRPLPVDEVNRFDDHAHRRRLSVKPGLTCLWQISGRNEVKDFKDWVRLDLEYIDNWSLWLDLKILFRTIPAVLVGTGAK